MNRSDRLVPKAVICRLIHIRPQRYTYWARTGVLERGSGGLTFGQAVQVTVLVALLKNDISLQAVRSNWEALVVELNRTLPVGDVYLIWDNDTFVARLVTGQQALARHVIGTPRPQIIHLKTWLDPVMAKFAKSERSQSDSPNSIVPATSNLGRSQVAGRVLQTER